MQTLEDIEREFPEEEKSELIKELEATIGKEEMLRIWNEYNEARLAQLQKYH